MTVITTSDQTDIAYHGPDMIGIGYVTDDTLRALYDMSDGLVTPTLYEAGSFPIFEAMMVGKPVVCSRIPPIVEQLERDGAEAELFDPNDPIDIAAALTRLRDMGSGRRARRRRPQHACRRPPQLGRRRRRVHAGLWRGGRGACDQRAHAVAER